MALQITITDQGRAEVINDSNNGTSPVTIATVAFGTGQYTPSAQQTALQSPIKDPLSTIAGVVVDPDTIHVTVRDESNDAYTVNEFGLFTDKGTLFAVYSNPNGSVMEKSAKSTLLLSVDIVMGTLNANSLSFGDTSFANPTASETVKGIAEIANQEEVNEGEDDQRFVTAKKLKAYIDVKRPKATTEQLELNESGNFFIDPSQIKKKLDSFGISEAKVSISSFPADETSDYSWVMLASLDEDIGGLGNSYKAIISGAEHLGWSSGGLIYVDFTTRGTTFPSTMRPHYWTIGNVGSYIFFGLKQNNGRIELWMRREPYSQKTQITPLLLANAYQTSVQEVEDSYTTTEPEGLVYFASSGSLTNPLASAVVYNNATSGLATTVQAAIDEVNAKVAASNVGQLSYFAGQTPPSGWIKWNGATLSRSTYADLWAFAQASGNLAASEAGKEPGQFGPGDGSTTFTLGESVDFIRSWDEGSERALGSWQSDEIRSHNHSLAYPSNSSSGASVARGGYAPSNSYVSTSSVGGEETRPANTAYLLCVKY